MPEPDIGHKQFTGFPFGQSQSQYKQDLRHLTVAELEDHLEMVRWLYIDPSSDTDAKRYFFVHQMGELIAELERRKKLLATHKHDKLAPTWKHGTMVNSRERIERIKARWPIDLFLQQSLGCELKPVGSTTFITRCPLPHHNDANPSFRVDTSRNLAYCFGCQRGGDVIQIARWYLNTGSFAETLTALENEGAIFNER